MEKQSHTSMPSRRWWRSRKVVYLGALIALLAGAYLFHDWIFMPEDLRRLQGKWVIVKVTDGRGDIEKTAGRTGIVTFKGRTAIWPGMPDDPVPFDVDDGTFFLYDPDNTHTILGFNVRLPLWLSRAKGVAFGTYEFNDGQLVLAFHEARQGKVRRHVQMKVCLERE